jgi:hypothetical protein
MQGLIHYNAHLSHQQDHAHAFMQCGFDATQNAYGEADCHVVSGPWFAKSRWQGHPRVLMIDRAYWGDPDCVSIGWLQADGSRKFATGTAPRPKPELEPWKTREDSCLILADYLEDVADKETQAQRRFVTVQTRLHPTSNTSRNVTAVSDAIRLRDVVVAGKGTACFDAILQGVPVICDPENACADVATHDFDAPLFRGDRSEWLHEMSYKQFSLSEIADGTAWNLLKDIQ